MSLRETYEETLKNKDNLQDIRKGIHCIISEMKRKLEVIDALDDRNENIEITYGDTLYILRGFMDRLIKGDYKDIKEAIKGAKQTRAYIKREGLYW